MTLDPRLPVVVGVGQTQRRPEDVAAASEPVDMMADALRLAADDAGGRGNLLQAADSIRVNAVLSWRYADAGALLATRLGATPAETVQTTTGGNSPQLVLNDTALAIQRGDVRVALVAGAEAMYTRQRARKVKAWLPWEAQSDVSPGLRVLGDDRPGSNDSEMARSLAMPTQVYPVFENALRAAAGESIDEHQQRIAALWARFSDVAAKNPHAWSPHALTADEIAAVTADNRMIGFPYTKLMNANLTVDQSAALIVCSVEAARDAGVPEDRWVFLWSGADAHDHWWVSERHNLHSSPAIRIAGRAALEGAGIGIDDVAHVDLYSCFPSAVQLGAAELGLALDDPARALTVTGGLTFAGGPGNNYATHSVATLVGLLRAAPGSIGLATALGWYATKHSIGVYSSSPPPAGAFRHARPQRDVDALPRRAYVAEHDGDVIVESYTVMHERDGSPALGIVACLLPDGARAWGNVREAGALKGMTVDDVIGRRARLQADGTLDLV